jgi:hypothetical protein
LIPLPRPATLGLAISVALSLAWVRPALPKGAPKATAEAGEKLDYVIVEVNGQPRLVKANGELPVLRGDRLRIKEAALVDKRVQPKEVNLVGYQSPKGDDRGHDFTTMDLRARHSEDGKGDVFAVVVQSKKELHGAVYIRLMNPVLRYAEVSINGNNKVLRDGEAIEVKSTDLVKVERVVTNLDKNDDVLFQIAPVDPANTRYEIRFQRGGTDFARIPLKIEP